MQRFGRVMAVSLASLAVAISVWQLAGFVAGGWFSREPFFDWDGEYTFNCYLNRDLPADAFRVTFSKSGTRALIRFHDSEVPLTFQRGGFAGDIFRGGGLTLEIDPEAYVDGYLDRRIGPCDTTGSVERESSPTS